MLFRVLGTLEIDSEGGPLSAGGPVPRRVLTALLAGRGAVVPVDGLLDAAWGDDPPASAERSLQSHLTRLRDVVMAADPDARVERHNGGYRVVVDPERLDAVRFERLVGAARAAPPGDAVVWLREALGLWRGPTPFVDLQDTAFPAAEAGRLVELRGAAVEALVGALLDSGDAAAASVECEARLGEDPFRERLWEVLVVALYRQGRQGDALAACRRARRELREGLGLEPGPRLREIEAQVLAQDPTLQRRASTVRQPCPYKGLARYDAGDADLFVGREALVDELLGRLVDGRLLVVVGPSGAGKSSLVRAGLVPALAAGGLPGSAAWEVRVLVPGPDPVGVLRAAIDDRADLVVLDQAEEALLGEDGAHVAGFGDAVLAAVDAGTRIVLALRADFYGRLTEHPALARRVGSATVLVAPPDDDELRRIVVEPASRVGLRVEPALVDLVLSEVSGRPGALPVLSTALVRTWEHRQDAVLSVSSYRAGGGVEAALQRVGEEAWSALDGDEERAACRRILLRLATDEDGQWVRRRARRTDVASAEDAAAVASLAVLADRRLLVVRADDVEIAHEALLTGWPRLLGWLEDSRSQREVLDALAVAAAAWAASGRDTATLYRGTRLQAAIDTAAASPDDLTVAERTFLDASRAEADRELTEQRERADREAAGRRRVRAIAAGLAAALVLAAVAGGVAVRQQRVASDAARAADAAALSADAQRVGALARGSAALDVSLLLAAQAMTLNDSPQTESDLLTVLERAPQAETTYRAPGRVLGIGISPDQETVLAGTVDGSLARWPLASGGLPTVTRVDASVQDLRVLPDGRVLVLLSPAGAPPYVDVLDASTGRSLARGPEVSGDQFGVSPDGTVMASPSVPRNAPPDRVVLWRVGSDPSTALTVPFREGVVGVSACGAQAACVLTRDRRLWRVAWDDGRRLGSITLDADPQGWIAAADDGRSVAMTSADGFLRVLDPSTGRTLHTIAAGQGTSPLAFSPDGSRLASRDRGSAVTVYDVDGSRPPVELSGHGGPVIAGTWSSDGRSLLTAGLDGSAIRWDMSGQDSLGRVLTSTLPVDASTLWASLDHAVIGEVDGGLTCIDLESGAVRHSDPATDPHRHEIGTARSGRTGLFVVTDVDNVTAVWDPTTCRPRGVVGLPAPADGYGPDAWVSPDGTRAATLRSAAGLTVIDVARRTSRQLAPLPAKEGFASFVTGWTPDGTGVLVVRPSTERPDGELIVVDAASGAVRMVAPLPGARPYEAVADPKGRFDAVSMDDGTVRFVDAHDGHALVTPLQLNAGPLYNVSVGPDGRYVSASGAPPGVFLIDTVTLRQVGSLIPPELGAEDARSRISPSGRLVVASGRTVRLYRLGPEAWLSRACAVAGRPLTRDEWAQFLPGRPYAPACTGPRASTSTS